GPHGVLVVVECATDNPVRTVANVKMYFNKTNGSLAPTGSLDYMFQRKAIFEFPATPEINIEELEFELIDAGLETLEEEEGTIYATADYTSFGTLSAAFEEKGIEINKANLKRIPTTPVEFTEEQLVDIEKLIDRLEDDDDIQAVFTNIA
ncbi:MAG: hypothetical protein RIS47_92, partial [Bacteroidota bacterium]